MKHEQTTAEYNAWCRLYDEIVVNYGMPISQPQRDQWWSQELSGWPVADLEKAVAQHMRQHKFFPTLADLIAARPVRYRKVADVDRDAGLKTPFSDAVVTLTGEQERIIGMLSDAQVREVLSKVHTGNVCGVLGVPYAPGQAEQAIEANLSRFRNGCGMTQAAVAEAYLADHPDKSNVDPDYKPF